jgi:hypothetical protein
MLSPLSVQLPWLGVAETYCSSVGRGMVTTALVAVLGPLLVAVMVKVSAVPVRGEVLAAEMVTAMSAWFGSVIEVFAVAELLALLGSAAVPAAETESEITVPAVTPLFAVTTKLIVELLPEAMLAVEVQVKLPPEGAAQVQPVPAAET